MNEPELIAQLMAGNAEAFEQFVAQYANRVFNVAIGLLQNAEDAEDLAQEVFVEVFQSIATFKGESALSTWVYRITVSKCLELIRKRKTKKRFAFVESLFKKDEVTLRNNLPDFHHPGVLIENQELAATLFKAIAQLPVNQQTAFTLHKLEQLSYAEIAETMELTVSSVESLLFRAKQNLQKILATFYEEYNR